MPDPDQRPTLAAPDDDPFLWLEAVEGIRSVEWVNAQNGATLSCFADTAVAADADLLQAIFERPDAMPYIDRRGGRIFNHWTDEQHPRGLWRATSLEGFRNEHTDWQVILDLDALAGREGEDWIWRGAVTLPGTHDRAIFELSRGGRDAVVLREFDLATCDFVSGGFDLQEGRNSVVWLDRDTLLLSSPLGPNMQTRSGLPRAVRLWHRGTDPAKAPIIFQTRQEFVGAWASVERDNCAEHIWFTEKPGLFDAIVWRGDRTGPHTRLALPSDARVQPHRGWLAIQLRTPWAISGRTFAADTVVGISFAGFLSGDYEFTTLFEASDRRALQDFFWGGSSLVLSILENLKPVLEILTPGSGSWPKIRIAGLIDIGVVTIRRLDAQLDESNGDLLAVVEDPLTPPSLFLIRPNSAPELLRRAPPMFDSSGLVMGRYEAESTDGTRVPYVQVGPSDRNGDAPVHLTGYGGFGIPLLPYYNPALGKLWLERGGTTVITHLRGGGEFGTAWHNAGRREGRLFAHDDFAAVAADLVRRGVTRPGRIATEGGSNGGLLVANMLTRYPERFGAVFCTVPILDMRRFSKLLIGPALVDEFGDPDNPEDWKFLGKLSAYHCAVSGKPYPPILIATNRLDDRAHPGHARKMAAKLQTMGYQAWFYELATGGHSYGKDYREQSQFISLGLAFLRRSIGWDVTMDRSAQ